MRRFVVRWLLWPLLVVAIPGFLVLAGGWYWLSTSLPTTSGTAALAGVKAPIEIIRDHDGIPHIFAQSEEDAAFALGFVHAQDRLWQMEQIRRLASGRLAELVGAAALPLDRFTRTIGLEQLAASSLAKLDPAMRAKLNAYAAGVNAFLEQHRGAWPPEFMMLGVAPERWRATDSLLWGELMAVQLSGHWRRDLLRARLLQNLSPAQVDQLWPPYPDTAPTTLSATASLYRGLPFDRLSETTAALDGRGASNAWVVDGAHSETGKPILANDPHLGFSLPGLWYLARIETPTFHVAGATVPGVPAVILGHNDRIAWGMTTTGGDVEDLFIEKLDPQSPDRYLAPEGSLPFRTRTEVINVRGGKAVTLTVRETRHGPVISDVVEDLTRPVERGTVVALSASWLRPDNQVAEAVYKIDKAGNWNEFLSALRIFDAPEQNLTYADVDGHIGFYAAGDVPVRKSGDGRLPMPGWTGEYDWIGTIPFDELPHGLDPRSGRFINANNKVTPPSYPHFITVDGWDWPYRAQRIENLLDRLPKASLDDMAKIQADSVSLAARDLLPFFTSLEPTEPDAKALVDRVRGWDGTMNRNRPEPLILSAWTRELNRVLLADKLGPSFRSFWGQRVDLIKSILVDHPEWCARGSKPEPSDCRRRANTALARALAWLSSHYGRDVDHWRWGDAHQAEFRHRIFDRIPVIGSLINVHIAADGGDNTINRGAFDVTNEASPFADVHGAGFRGIYDLSDLSRSRFMVATGQSGNPLSRHFTDLVRRWRDFDYVTLTGNREELLATGGSLLTLTPLEIRNGQ